MFLLYYVCSCIVYLQRQLIRFFAFTSFNLPNAFLDVHLTKSSHQLTLTDCTAMSEMLEFYMFCGLIAKIRSFKTHKWVIGFNKLLWSLKLHQNLYICTHAQIIIYKMHYAQIPTLFTYSMNTHRIEYYDRWFPFISIRARMQASSVNYPAYPHQLMNLISKNLNIRLFILAAISLLNSSW